MEKRKNGYAVIFVVITCMTLGAIILWYCNFIPKEGGTAISDSVREGKLVIVNLNVGKGDACVICYKGITGIIDTGEPGNIGKFRKFFGDNDISRIDFLLLSHYDNDHIGCAADLINNYDIERVIVPDYASGKKYYRLLLSALKGRENVDVIDEHTSYRFDSLSFDIMPASDKKTLSENADDFDNNMSLVVKLSYGLDSFLFAGDIEEDRMKQLLNDGYRLDADWIKMSGHGRFKKNLEALLKAVSPSYAVISTGANNEYTLENKTVDLLDKLNIKMYVTTYGDVTTVSDGVDIRVAQ